MQTMTYYQLYKKTFPLILYFKDRYKIKGFKDLYKIKGYKSIVKKHKIFIYFYIKLNVLRYIFPKYSLRLLQFKYLFPKQNKTKSHKRDFFFRNIPYLEFHSFRHFTDHNNIINFTFFPYYRFSDFTNTLL